MLAAQGDSLYQYSNTTLYKWHVAVAVMCLATLTAGLANLMWHVSVVVRQKKSWYDCLSSELLHCVADKQDLHERVQKLGLWWK